MVLQSSLDVKVDHINKRLKVFEAEKDIPAISDELVEIAEKEDLEKIIFFGKEEKHVDSFLEQGFVQEAVIDGFFDGETAYLLSKFLSDERQSSDNIKHEDKILQKIENMNPSDSGRDLPDDYSIRSATNDDIPQIVQIFKQVFSSYPIPMNDPSYVEEAINSNVDMVVTETEKGIVGLSSAEIDFNHRNAEITDCATLPSERGKGLMNHMIRFLEQKMKKNGILHLFSIARARSFGMNKVLYNLKYQYQGRMINNVHIAGNWENMNIWTKQLDG